MSTESSMANSGVENVSQSIYYDNSGCSAYSVDFLKWNPSTQFYPIQVETPSDIIKWMDLSPQNIELVVTRSVE